MTILELKQPLWMKTPYGEGLAIFLTDYGPESDHIWTCIQQEAEYKGQIWSWHNSEVRVLDNRSMLRQADPPQPIPVQQAYNRFQTLAQEEDKS